MKKCAGYAQSYKLIIASGSFTAINRKCVNLYSEYIVRSKAAEKYNSTESDLLRCWSDEATVTLV